MNYFQWFEKYKEILIQEHESFCFYLEINKEKEVEFNEFCNYIYDNTNKYWSPKIKKFVCQ